MKNCRILKMILDVSVENISFEIQKSSKKSESCGFFLCSSDGTCKCIDVSVPFLTSSHYYDIIASVTDIVLTIGNNDDYIDVLFSAITRQNNWAMCFDRRNVWNFFALQFYNLLIYFQRFGIKFARLGMNRS